MDLADGRKLAYLDWGEPDAPTVFYCHGFPGNRQELRITLPIVERRALDARLVAINRPGYGPSTFTKRHGFLEWTQDLEEAADRLGIHRFGVLGASGGGPYALAAGHRLGSRVTRIGIVVGVAPVGAPGMRQAPGIALLPTHRAAARFQFEMASLAFRIGRENRVLELALSSERLGEADRAAMARPEMRAWLLRVIKEAYAQGGRAAAAEAGLYRKPWGFDVGEVGTETLLWYGGADETIPVSAGRWLADRLSRSRLTVWPGHGHFTWADSAAAAQVVEAMIAPDIR